MPCQRSRLLAENAEQRHRRPTKPGDARIADRTLVARAHQRRDASVPTERLNLTEAHRMLTVRRGRTDLVSDQQGCARVGQVSCAPPPGFVRTSLPSGRLNATEAHRTLTVRRALRSRTSVSCRRLVGWTRRRVRGRRRRSISLAMAAPERIAADARAGRAGDDQHPAPPRHILVGLLVAGGRAGRDHGDLGRLVAALRDRLRRGDGLGRLGDRLRLRGGDGLGRLGVSASPRW